MPQYRISLIFWRDSILGGLSKPSKVNSTHIASITATQIQATAHRNHVIAQWKGTTEATGNPCASSLPHLTNPHLTKDPYYHVIARWKGMGEDTGHPCTSALPHLTNPHLTKDPLKSLCNCILSIAKEGSCWCSDFSCHFRWDNCCCKGWWGSSST